MTRYFFFLFILTTALYSAQDEFEVRLATEKKLEALYQSPIADGPAGLSLQYVADLDKVLRYDLAHNGKTVVLPTQKERDAWDISSQGTIPLWEQQRVSYVVKPIVKDGILSARLLDVKNRKIVSFDNLKLSGNQTEDRKIVHKLADSIHKALFGTEGIASTKIIYTVKVPDGKNDWTSEVWIADYDGKNAKQLTHDHALCVTPAFLPPKPGYVSTNFLYACYKSGVPKIFLASTTDGKGQRISTLRGNQLMPAISNQRDKIAFVSDASGNPDIFLLPLTAEPLSVGKPRQIYAVPYATQASPTFDPSGNRIALVSNKDGQAKIYVMEIPREGATTKYIQPQLLVKRGRETTAPAWSPDGTKIAYTSPLNGVRQIFVYDLNTKEELQLTDGPGHKENPSWAPNSCHLVYNGTIGKETDLYITDLNSLKSVKITEGQGEKRFPSWERR